MAEAAAAEPTLCLVWEGVGEVPDEGYDRFAGELVRALAGRRPLVSLDAPRPSPGPALRRFLDGQRTMLGVALSLRLVPRRGATVYALRNPVTVPGVLRAQALRWLGGAPVVLAVLVPNRASSAAMRLLRRLPPAALLVGSEADAAAAAGYGLSAGVIWGGVDTTRFRPPAEGEKSALRERYGLPARGAVVLHVGHLRRARGLDALVPLAGEGVTVLVVASGRRSADSDEVRRELKAGGVRVLDGYQPRLEEIYRVADCYAFPGAADGAVSLPLSILEAAASGLPVVSVAYEAVGDRLRAFPWLHLAASAAEVPALVRQVLAAPPPPAVLSPEYSWPGVAGRVLGAAEGAGGRGREGRAAPAARVRLVARRGLLRGAALVRRLRGRREPAERALQPAVIELEREPPRGGLGLPVSDRLAIAGGGRPDGAAAACARVLGLTIESAARQAPPLVLATAGGLARDGSAERLREHLAAGATLLVEDLGAATGAEIEAAERALGAPLPRPRPALPVAALRFPAGARRWLPDLAGARVQVSGREGSLQATAGWVPLCMLDSAAGPALAAAGRTLPGGGRLLVSALGANLEGRLGDALDRRGLPAVLLPLALLRALYGAAAWHPPARLANFTIDDPALVEGRPGLPYRRLEPVLAEAGLHLTVATIPAELGHADPAVVGLLAAGGHLSACYHGCRHDGYEFSLDAQAGAHRRELARAAAHGRRFARRHGLALDRVMVFPHGIGPAYLLPDLARLGFLGTSNFANRLPLGHPVPGDPDLGTRPADLAWHGFPLLWRRPVEHRDWMLDLLLGRPVLLFGHGGLLDADFRLLAGRGEEVGRAAPGPVAWRGLEEVARHAYLQRCGPGGWEVLMTAMEACLHNPDLAPRRFRVVRPHMPEGFEFDAPGPHAGGELTVEVPPGATRTVRLSRGEAAALPAPGRPCTVFEGGTASAPRS